MDNRHSVRSVPLITIPTTSPPEEFSEQLRRARQAGQALRHWAGEILAAVQTGSDLRDLLTKLLIEVRRDRQDQVQAVEPRWLKVDQARRYLGGMSETWIRDLEKVAPRGLFRRVRGTVFIDRAKLDRIMEGDLELDDT